MVALLPARSVAIEELPGSKLPPLFVFDPALSTSQIVVRANDIPYIFLDSTKSKNDASS